MLIHDFRYLEIEHVMYMDRQGVLYGALLPPVGRNIASKRSMLLQKTMNVGYPDFGAVFGFKQWGMAQPPGRPATGSGTMPIFLHKTPSMLVVASRHGPNSNISCHSSPNHETRPALAQQARVLSQPRDRSVRKRCWRGPPPMTMQG